MNAVTSLLDFILNLLRDPQAQAQFKANPEKVLAQHGLTGVCAGDINEALPLVADHPAVALSDSGSEATTPPPADPVHGQSDLHTAIEHLDYITKTYTYTDNHNTTIDDSVHQNIWAQGDVTQTFDDSNVVASGDGSVAAGGSVDGTVTTGHGDAVGTGAAAGTGNVTGSGNALGTGSAAGTGNALANGTGAAIGDGNTVANGAGSAAGTGNTMANGDHVVQGTGDVQGQVSSSQVATAGGTNASDSSHHVTADNGNTDLHSFGAGATNTIGSANTSSATTASDNTSHSGNTSDTGNTTDSGNTTDTHTVTDSGDDNGTHTDVSHSAVGDTYTDNSQHDSADVHATHDAGLILGIH